MKSILLIVFVLLISCSKKPPEAETQPHGTGSELTPNAPFSAGNKHEISIGAVKIRIPLPDAFSNILDTEEELKTVALAATPSGFDLFGVYADAAAQERAQKNGPILPLRLRVAASAKTRDKVFAETDLATLRALVEKKAPTVFKVGTPEFDACLRRLSDKFAQATREKGEFAVSDIANFGVVAAAPDHFTTMIQMIESFKGTDKTLSAPCLVACTYATIKGRLVLLFTSKGFETADDVATVQKFSEDWFNQIRKANP